MIDLSERAKTSECGCQTPLRQQLVLVRVEFTEENFLTFLTTFFHSAGGCLCGSNRTNISLGGLEPFSNLICSVFQLRNMSLGVATRVFSSTSPAEPRSTQRRLTATIIYQRGPNNNPMGKRSDPSFTSTFHEKSANGLI